MHVDGVYRPLVGDFDGNGTSDIFWYRSGGASSIWLFDATANFQIIDVDVFGDYAPIVGRFNADGCDDILWFDAVNDRVFKWASRCNGTFDDQGARDTPANAYPVGYGIAR